jgi:fructose-bisphosphate aldolase, class I
MNIYNLKSERYSMDFSKKLMTRGKTMMLAYDQGLEHGPTDFNDKNADPKFIMDIANKGKYNAVIFQKGIAEKYYIGKVPLIVKLNGRTRLWKGEPISTQICSVKEAKDLGAKGVGYTIYIGSKHEPQMLKEFGKIEEEAHEKGMAVIAWMYPRGQAVKNDMSREILSYAARAGLELGADMIKIKFNGNASDLKWMVKVAGKSKIVIAGGAKKTDKEFLEEVNTMMKCGASGIAVGRNVWQNENPMKMSKDLKKIIFSGK